MRVGPTLAVRFRLKASSRRVMLAFCERKREEYTKYVAVLDLTGTDKVYTTLSSM